MVSEDGRFFGVKLAPEMATKARELFPIALTYLTEKGEDIVAKKWGPGAGNVAGLGIALSQQIYQTGENIYGSLRSLHDLKVSVHPLEKAAGHNKSTSALSGNNEVVANARSKIGGVFWQRMIQTAVGTISAAPALLTKFSKQSAKKHQHELEADILAAKGNPERIAEIYEKELTGTLTKKVHGEVLSPRERQQGKLAYIAKEEAAYVAKFETFKTTNRAAVSKEMSEALGAVNKDNVHFKLKELEKLGLDTSTLSTKLKGDWFYPPDGSARVFKRPEGDEITPLIKNYLSNIQGKGKEPLPQYVDAQLQAKFVRKEGAWDHEWRGDRQDRGYGSHDREELTIKQQLEQNLQKVDEERRKFEQEKLSPEKGHGQDHNVKHIMDMGWGLAAGFTGEFFTKLVGGKALDQYSKPIALDRILHLRRILEAPKDQPNWTPPEEVPPITTKDGEARERGNDSFGYVQDLHNIFQQHQKDSKRVDIGDRFVQHFDATKDRDGKWVDAEIQKLSDDELTPYEYALKTLAKRIKDGRMDAIALVDLVGDTHGKRIVQADGRTFGPAGVGKDDAAIKKAILHLIDEKTALVHAVQEQTDEQVNDKLGNFIFSVDDLKKALSSNDLEQSQRAFLFTLFSDVVGSDAKLCEKLGIKNERCQELRKECKECFAPMLGAAVVVLAEMIENEPEELEKKMKLTEKEKKLILSLAERVKEEGKNVADLTENRDEIKTLETVAANAVMTLDKGPPKPDENGKPQGFWQRLMAVTRQPKQPKEAKPKEPVRKSKHNEDSEFSDHDVKKPKRSRFESENDTENEKEWAASTPSKKKGYTTPSRDDDGMSSMSERVLKKRSKSKDKSAGDPSYTQAI